VTTSTSTEIDTLRAEVSSTERSAMTSLPAATSRYHALDSLRAAMMFLGIYLHAVVAYSPSGGWPYKQAQLTTSLDTTMAVIHIFRMPVFYVMAGFFTALLLQRYGFWRAAKNRLWRIVVPFVVGWVILFPLVTLLAGSGRYGFDRAHPMHLWFLEYLIVLYVLAAIAVVIVPALLPGNLRALLLRLFRSALQSPWAPLFFAVPSFLVMLQMKVPWLEDPPSFAPIPRIVIAYAIPFAFGWLLFFSTDLLETLSRRAWPYTVLAVVASGAYLGTFVIPMDRNVAFYVGRAVHSVALWLLIFAVTGLFLRYLSGHSAYRRYLCDSSYFLYIAHMPVIIVFQLLLKDIPLPPLVKMALVLTAAIVVLLPLYRYCVRPTFVGAVLNGRKYPSALAPAVAAAV
jgi:glucan biosynthesis protein C